MFLFSVLLALSLGPEGRCCSLEGGAAPAVGGAVQAGGGATSAVGGTISAVAGSPCSIWTLPGASRVRSPTVLGMVLRHKALVKCICKTAYAACVHCSVFNRVVYLSSLSKR